MRKFLLIIFPLFFAFTSVAQFPGIEWAYPAGGTGYDYGSNVLSDDAGNTYLAGSFKGTVDFDPSSVVAELTSTSSQGNYYIAKMDVSGNLLWVKQITVPGSGLVDMTRDINGNIYLTGNFLATGDFDPSNNSYNMTAAGDPATGSTDVFVLKLDASGNFVWAKQFGAEDYDHIGGIKTDNLGNVYVHGYFAGSIDFDQGPGECFLTSAGNGYTVFILKLDASGNFVWAKQQGGTGSIYGFSISLDDQNNVYTTGFFINSVDFDPSGAQALMSTTGNLDQDAYVSKLDASGNFVWAKQMHGANVEFGSDIKAGPTGVYVLGQFQSDVDVDPSSTNYILPLTGDRDFFILKLDFSGNFIWAHGLGSPALEEGEAIALDASENIYLTGQFSETIDFDPGSDVFNLTAQSRDIFIAKYNSSGDFIWAKSAGGSGSDAAYSIFVDTQNKVYVTGIFSNTVSFDPLSSQYDFTSNGQFDIFAARYNQDLPTGIQSSLVESKIVLYPNPVKDSFHLNFNSFKKEASVKLLNAAGVVVYETMTQPEELVTIDVSNQPKGLYFVQISSEKETTVLKVVKE